MSVRSHSYVTVSLTCHQLAADANTQNYEKSGVQFTAITWQRTQIHRPMRKS